MLSPVCAILLAVLSAELSSPAPTEPLLDRGYRQMYNLQFADAHRTFTEFERQRPADPLGPASDAAAYLFAEFDRLDILRADFAVHNDNFLAAHRAPAADPALKSKFEAAMQRSQELAAPGLHRSPPEPAAMFADVLRKGLHADYLALIEKRNLAALTEVKEARVEADKLLAAHPDYYDAYIAVALENYLLSQKAAPLRWMLRATGSQTDKQTGIDKLRLTASKGHYLGPYARVLLAVAALRDHDQAHAKEGLQWLAGEFPGNRLYREELAKLN